MCDNAVVRFVFSACNELGLKADDGVTSGAPEVLVAAVKTVLKGTIANCS